MACLDNIIIQQTVTYSAAPNTVDGLLVGSINIQILNAGLAPILGSITIDKIREVPVVDINGNPITQTDIITSDNETFVYNFYYSVSQPLSITINATVDVRIADCLYKSSCNHVLLTPNPSNEVSECSVETYGYNVVSGCTDSLYFEYNPNANVDDGSCSILRPVLGCTNPISINYNPLATKNDGSCVFTSGCTNPIANNYDEIAVIDDGTCDCGDINIQLDFFNTSGESFILTGDCDYFIEFDLITKIDCKKFLTYFENETKTILEILNSLKINAQIFVLLDEDGNPVEYFGNSIDISGNSEFLLIQNENIFTFNIENNTIGVGLIETNEYCDTFFDLIATEQGLECQSFDKTKFDITWKSYKIALNSDLTNTFTKFNLNFENFKFGICAYIDNLKISSVCTTKYEKCTMIPSVYGFELEKIVDNKKAWTTTTTTIDRTFNTTVGRETDYIDYDSRLIFNTKELELQVNPMKYIQKDVLDYYGFFGKFYRDIDTRLLSLTYDNIKYESINVNNRQVSRNYSFLPYIYEQYLDGLDCAKSKSLDYSYGLEIIAKTGNLWYQLVSQLVPSTAIWSENQFVIKNNIFNFSKHQYKRYSLDVGTGCNVCENCAPSGVTISCEKISDNCFGDSMDSIDDLLISGTSQLICEKSGDTVCFSDFQHDGSFSGKIIQYVESSGDTIEVLNLFGYQNYNCFTGDTPDVIYGCTNPLAINYNPLATVDDGSCIICPPIVYGCTYPSALNYDSNANFDDGSCVFGTGATLVDCTEDVDDFNCELEYVYTAPAFPNEAVHEFLLKLTSPTLYSGGISGSWTIGGINHREPIQSDPSYREYVKGSDATTEIFGYVEDYIEMGFNNLTDPSSSIAIPPTSSDSAWFVTILENSLVTPSFTSGYTTTVNVQFVTENGCIFTDSISFQIGGLDLIPSFVLTKIFPQ